MYIDKKISKERTVYSLWQRKNYSETIFPLSVSIVTLVAEPRTETRYSVKKEDLSPVTLPAQNSSTLP